ncbi:hypothetical protein STEG23_018617 [Scotinomys teguina]
MVEQGGMRVDMVLKKKLRVLRTDLQTTGCYYAALAVLELPYVDLAALASEICLCPPPSAEIESIANNSSSEDNIDFYLFCTSE